MKKSIRVSMLCTFVAVFAVSNAHAQNVTTVNLSANVPAIIDLGELRFETTNGANITGSGNTFNGVFPAIGNTMADYPQLSVYWDNALVSSAHTLKISSLNGGMVFQGGSVPEGFTGVIPYAADLRWMNDDASMAFLFLLNENAARTHETSRGPNSGSLRIAAQAYEVTNLASGTYSDTLTATITPTP